jgi:hypothetical protein
MLQTLPNLNQKEQILLIINIITDLIKKQTKKLTNNLPLTKLNPKKININLPIKHSYHRSLINPSLKIT